VSHITVADVDALKATLLGEGLAPSSVNKCLKILAQILEVAVERDHAPRNVAQGRRRRVREPTPRRTYLDAADHIRALLAAASALDAAAREDRRHIHRHALLAVLTFAGLRLGEARMLRWRDVDLAGGWLHVGDAKTDAGRRRVKIRPALRDVLVTLKATAGETEPDAIVFATRNGKPPGHTNVIRRVLRPAIAAANVQLAERQLTPLPEGLTPHSLRRTFASLLVRVGRGAPRL
jgi:integrase